MNTPQIQHLKDIYASGIQAVDPYQIMMKSIVIDQDTLTIQNSEKIFQFDLKLFKKIAVIGFGKATAKMAKAVEEVLSYRIDSGLISVKYGHTEDLSIIKTIEAGHPIPDSNSEVAAARILSDSAKYQSDTLVLVLISGGGSALVSSPYKASDSKVQLNLKDKQQISNLLLSCGASIQEINCVRKHLSSIKGGRLAKALYPATTISLILSDVIGDPLDVIASGTTVPDTNTFSEVKSIINRYGLEKHLSQNINKIVQYGLDGIIPETPKADDKLFDRVTNIVIGNNYDCLVDARLKAEQLGYTAEIMNGYITGDVEDAALWLHQNMFRKIKKHPKKKLCLITGGETTVRLTGSGKGGRNQHLALCFLYIMSLNPIFTDHVYFMSAGTDGNDGPTDAAGAFASSEILNRSKKLNLDIAQYLKTNDSYRFYEQLDYLFKTGPTNTNVCDIQVMIYTGSQPGSPREGFIKSF